MEMFFTRIVSGARKLSASRKRTNNVFDFITVDSQLIECFNFSSSKFFQDEKIKEINDILEKSVCGNHFTQEFEKELFNFELLKLSKDELAKVTDLKFYVKSYIYFLKKYFRENELGKELKDKVFIIIEDSSKSADFINYLLKRVKSDQPVNLRFYVESYSDFLANNAREASEISEDNFTMLRKLVKDNHVIGELEKQQIDYDALIEQRSNESSKSYVNNYIFDSIEPVAKRSVGVKLKDGKQKIMNNIKYAFIKETSPDIGKYASLFEFIIITSLSDRSSYDKRIQFTICDLVLLNKNYGFDKNTFEYLVCCAFKYEMDAIWLSIDKNDYSGLSSILKYFVFSFICLKKAETRIINPDENNVATKLKNKLMHVIININYYFSTLLSRVLEDYTLLINSKPIKSDDPFLKEMNIQQDFPNALSLIYYVFEHESDQCYMRDYYRIKDKVLPLFLTLHEDPQSKSAELNSMDFYDELVSDFISDSGIITMIKKSVLTYLVQWNLKGTQLLIYKLAKVSKKRPQILKFIPFEVFTYEFLEFFE